MKGHTDTINSVSFSPDSTKIVTGSSDNKAMIWDAKSIPLIGVPLKGHSDAINSVCFSQDGTRILTASND